jgi:mobilome CxxCx(11)CxxC protein
VVNTNEQVRHIAEWILGFLGLLQLLMAVWSLVARWDDDRAYSIFATRSNSTLRAEWESVAKAQATHIEAEYNRVQAAEKIIEQEDLTKEISDKEKRYGMRAGLLFYRKACAVCKLVPTSMKPTNCDVCGNF